MTGTVVGFGVVEVVVGTVVVVVGVVVDIVVVSRISVTDVTLSTSFSDVSVLFNGPFTQHLMLAVGHGTSSKTSSQINVAKA